MRVNILSTGPLNCGIGATNQYLVDGMEPYLDMEDISIRRIFIDKPFSKNPFYFMKLGLDAATRCDLIHVHYNHDNFGKIGRIHGFNNPFVYLMLNLSGKPIITTIHENPDLTNAGFLRRAMYAILNFFPLRFSKVIITTTPELLNSLKFRGINSKRCYVIPHGTFKDDKPKPTKEAKKELGLENKKVITLFGFIDSNKGHHMIIDALKDLPPDYFFLIAGEARSAKGKVYKQELIDSIINNNLVSRVKFFGLVNKRMFSTVMGATDLLVFPYTDITSSLALTTSLSYERPVLTSDILPFIRFKEKHDCIEIFNLEDRKSLLSKIMEITTIKSIRDNLRKKRIEYVLENDWTEMGRKQILIYKHTLD